MISELKRLLSNSYAPYDFKCFSCIVEMKDGKLFNGVTVKNAIFRDGTENIEPTSEWQKAVVEYLADILPTLQGVKRGVVAMSLIRIGEDALSALEKRARENAETAWIYNYLISEIR